MLFAGSIRDNICRGRDRISDEEVVKAAKRAGVHDFVVDLPEGYATEVGEGGLLFSSGQRQRIAIARALIGDPPLLLLDEPSSNLDRPTEAGLAQLLAHLARDHNVLIVTHSPIMLAVCRNVLLLERGRVAAAGPPHEILPRIGVPVAPRLAPVPPTPAPADAKPTAKPA